MKRNIFIILVTLLLTMTACSFIPSKVLTVDESYSGKEIALSQYATLTISLVSNPAAGYSWNEDAQISGTGVIQQTDYKYVPSKVPLADAPGTQVWTFNAMVPGTSVIAMYYQRAYGNTNPPDPAFIITVVVK